MNKYLVIIAIICLMTSCTTLPRKMPNGISDCPHNDLDCIDRILDDTRFDQDSECMFTAMEGYEPASLQELKEMGRLTVNEINPVLPMSATVLGIGTYAYTKVRFSKYGDIYDAQIYYPSWIPGLSNYFYAHEAMHAQGTFGCGLFAIHGSKGGYTGLQKKIMEEEGVDKWTLTNHYKNENDKYHWDGVRIKSVSNGE